VSVSEAQLKAWSNEGATTTAAATYKSVQTALSRGESLKKYRYNVYLQGSYGNGTNIYGNSDVDVVVELASAFYSDTSLLPMDQKAAYERQRSLSELTFKGFRDDVHEALVGYYKTNLVKPRNKCIEVLADSGRQNADVVPCFGYHLYTQFTSLKSDYHSGIKFLTRNENAPVINFPRMHMQNGEAKNKRVKFYKQTIRIFKNWRDQLIADGQLPETGAPSYFVECLCWNIPDSAFGEATWWKTIVACLKFLHGATLDNFICQNGVIQLFGPAREQWNVEAAKAFRRALITDWNK
jgi:hypothetical protein